MSQKLGPYKICRDGDPPVFGVVDRRGTVLYDCVETEALAVNIADVLNGFERRRKYESTWDDVEAELEARAALGKAEENR